MGTLKSYKDLIIWQKAILLSAEVYKLTSLFPKEEIFGLTSQTRRAAYSIPLNIAEGYGRNTTKNYVNSLYIAQGSLQELETAIILGCELGFISKNDCEKVDSLIIEEFKMFNSLINSLEYKINNKVGLKGAPLTPQS
jgi:four helix bundle protein